MPNKIVVVSGTQAESFRTAFIQHTETEPQILYLSAKTYGKQSVAGDIMEAPAAMADLDSFI